MWIGEAPPGSHNIQRIPLAARRGWSGIRRWQNGCARHNAALMRALVTGGAGFVGSNLAVGLATRHPDWELIALDNLRRRGSELNLPRLREAGVAFVHGDVRERADLRAVEPEEAIIEASAEPSALAVSGADTDYVVGANLQGAHLCLELARRDGAQV